MAVERRLPGTALHVLDDVQDINTLAAQASTNAYETLTSLGARYRRQDLTL
jgi:alanine racemase